MGMEGVWMVIEIEEGFGITLPHQEAGDCECVRDVIELVERLLKEKRDSNVAQNDDPSLNLTRDQISLRVREMTADVACLPLEKIQESDRFGRDLNFG